MGQASPGTPKGVKLGDLARDLNGFSTFELLPQVYIYITYIIYYIMYINVCNMGFNGPWGFLGI
jgi:hypothetical protein